MLSHRTGPAFRELAICALLVFGTVRAFAQNTATQGDSGDLKLANRLLADRLYAPAADEYERVMARPSLATQEKVEATYGLGTARLFLNRLAEARKRFEEFLALAPDHPAAANAWFRVGETAYLLGDLPAARAALEKFTTDFPTHRQGETAWPYLGDVALRQGEVQKARDAYEKAIASHPNGRLADRARCGLARALVAQGKGDEAIAVLTPIAETKGRELADQARFQIGQVHANAGRPEEALAAFERLERDSPRGPLLAEARLGRASALLKLRRPEQAEALLRAVIAEAPRNQASQAAYDLGVSQFDRGQLDEARATFNDALERFAGSPLIPALLYRAAETAGRLGAVDDARGRFVKMAALFPRDPWADDALLQAASLALKAKDLENAAETVDRLLDAYPDTSLRPAALLVQARVAEEAGRNADAIRRFEELLALPDLAADLTTEARYHLGLVYRKDGQKDKASRLIADLANGPAGAAVSSNARFLLGQSFIEEEKYEEAISPLEDYLKAQSKGDVAEVALAHLVHARVGLDQTDEALKTLRRLEDQFPQSAELTRARLRVGEQALKSDDLATAATLLNQVADKDDPLWKARAQFGLGWVHFKQGKYGEANETFDLVLAEAPEGPYAAEAAYMKGKALEALNHDEEALSAYSETERRHPKTKAAGSAALARARLLAGLNRPAAADAFAAYVATYTRAGDPGTDQVLAEWGAALNQAGRITEADAVFTRLLEEFPEGTRAAEAHLNLAVSAFDARKFEETERHLAPLLKEGPASEQALQRRALFLQGRLLVERQDWAQARATFDRVAAETGTGEEAAQARFWKAEAAFRSADPKTAETEFAALAESDETNQTAALRRVQCLVQLQEWTKALDLADALRSRLAPDDRLRPELDYQRGRALQSVAPPRFDEARAAYDAVLAAKTGDELAARAQFMKGETYFFAQDFLNARREFLKAYANYNAPRWQAAALLEAGKVDERLDQWPEAVEIYERLRSRFENVAEAADCIAEAAKRIDAARRKAADADKTARGGPGPSGAER